MAALVEAGVTVVGENRAQDLERKHAEYGDVFRWHFIGQLQSNKVKVVNRICELVHSLDSDSAARLRELAGELGLRQLSMGTTQDYRVAAEEGATHVRVGSLLFRD